MRLIDVLKELAEAGEELEAEKHAYERKMQAIRFNKRR